MKFISSILIALVIATTSLMAHSHNGHSHKTEPIDKATAEKKSLKILNSFIEKKVVDKSWKGIKVDSSSIKMYEGKEEWVVTFKNEKIEDVKKQKLFVFFTISGRYIAANYTGE